jgi:hypothetical protein
MTQPAAEPTPPSDAKQPDPERIPPSLWQEYEGTQVFVQLRDGIQYMAVSYPSEPVIQAEVEGPDGSKQTVYALASAAAARGVKGEPVASPIMQGILRIKQDVYGGVMLGLEFPDPLEQTPPGGRPRSMVKAIFPPDFVGFMSTVEQSLIR